MEMWEENVKAAHEALEEVGEAGLISDDAIENIVAWVMGNQENHKTCFTAQSPILARQKLTS